jgi:hypothetical protein
MSIVVYTEAEALNAVKSWPASVISLRKKKDNKAHRGCIFINVKWNLRSPTTNGDGWFSFKNAQLSRGITAPEMVKAGGGEQHEGVRLQVRFRKSGMGDIGVFLGLLQPYYEKAVAAAIADGTIVVKKQEVHTLVNLNYEPDHKEHPNEPIEDYNVSFKLDFEKFSENYPNAYLKGKPKTQIYDATKVYTDAAGRPQYELATVLNNEGKPELLDAKNVHKFLRKGSVVVSGRVFIPSLCVSQTWVSMAMTANRLDVIPGPEDGFSDEVAAIAMPRADEAVVKAVVGTTADMAIAVPDIQNDLDDF